MSDKVSIFQSHDNDRLKIVSLNTNDFMFVSRRLLDVPLSNHSSFARIIEDNMTSLITNTEQVMIRRKPSTANSRWLQTIYLEWGEGCSRLIRNIDETTADLLNLLICQSLHFFDKLGTIPNLNKIVILNGQKFVSEVVVSQGPNGDILGLVGRLAKVADLISDSLSHRIHRILIILFLSLFNRCAPNFYYTFLACSK